MLVACASGLDARAQAWLDDWQVSGTNTVRIESYGVRGDPLSGPYRFEGMQSFDELGVEALRRLSTYDTVRFQLYGVANDSDYRAPDHGVVPERINLSRVKGDAAIPYRIEAGDVFGYFTYRTLQRSLKGARVELQPIPSVGGIRQSLVILAGTNQPGWRHLQARDDWSEGLSWLVELDPRTRFTANVLHTTRQADASLGTLERRQTVASLTGDYGTQWAGQQLRLEGEAASLRGDHDGAPDANGVVDPASGRDRRGAARYAQLSGTSLAAPLDYRLRFERNDRDYRPAEGVVVPDHRAEEGHAAWRFADGLVLRGRVQQFVDGLQSGNDLRTTTYGATLAGPFTIAAASGSIDLFRQDFAKRDASVDRRTWNLNAALSRALPAAWTANLALSWQHLDDRVAGASNMTSTQVQIAATHPLRLGAWSGSVTPGITLRRVSGGPGAVDEAYPGLAFALASGAHAIGVSYGYQRLRPDATSVAEVDVNLLAATYTYTRARDTFGIEASGYDRRVTIGTFNESYRVSVFWRHAFEKPAPRAAAVPLSIAMAPLPAATTPVPRDPGALLAIAPGADYEATLQRLDDGGYRGGIDDGRVLAYEMRLAADVDARQRFAVEHEPGRVVRTAILVTLDDPNDAAAIAKAYERLRTALLDRLGAPAVAFEEGTLGPTFAADLNAGRVVRVIEWQVADGRVRLGIPRRLDGQVRIELQHAAGFAPPREASWSLEAVR
jgi:hypothetical protein